MSETDNNPSKVDVCLYGHGIVCGLTANVNQTCDIEIGAGLAITTNGTVVRIENKNFSYYLIKSSAEVRQYFGEEPENRAERNILELISDVIYDPSKMDSIKQQNPHDLPARDLLHDKVLVILLNENDQYKRNFLLVSTSLLLEKGNPDILKQVKELSKTDITESQSGIFKRPKKTKITYSKALIEKVIHPYLQLPEVLIPRFGYKKLAVIDTGQPFGTGNFVNPFSKISTFNDIFNEYKAILDDLIPNFEIALEKLHQLYGDQFTHKGQGYWKQYRTILLQKWHTFLEEGEHLYYIQYFYDWLTDLQKAYNELRELLSTFTGACLCDEPTKSEKYTFSLIQLGAVLGSRTSYTPTPFRDYFQAPMIDGDNAERWNEVRFLHWRMMMMIWTFDLPQLKLDEKVLVKGGYIIPAKEFEDSTNYFESEDINNDKITDLEDLPIKFTPSQTPDTLLGLQAIPYYYPLDADSPYSLHRYWNYRLSQMNRTHTIQSFNAFEENDTYANNKTALFSLAFNLRNYPFLRAEGHIGKKYMPIAVAPAQTTISTWTDLIQKYNLTVNVIIKKVSELNTFFSLNQGLEHIAGLEQGQTIVLVYVDNKEGEQIELNECKKDKAPEIVNNTIVVDFTIPIFTKK